MMATIKYLASEEMKGRGLGTPELDEAAEYIAQKFKAAGLKPINNSYFQTFTHSFKDKGEMKLTNVIGVIEGTDPEYKNNPVVVSLVGQMYAKATQVKYITVPTTMPAEFLPLLN